MSRGPTFIDRDEFARVLARVETVSGTAYQDEATVYGDMSRLVVAWLAHTSPESLQSLYNELGWKGSANVRAMHEAARRWFESYHPDRLHGVGDHAS